MEKQIKNSIENEQIIELFVEKKEMPLLHLEGEFYPYYMGEYLVSPGTEEIILKTANRVLSNEIIIEAIPDCYGIISYDGDALMIT
ncbi:MAG: hypothetical protein E7332_06475 [Clostridiales bacterium]|nr:hypothetical protein [Clostridiales bacterium]